MNHLIIDKNIKKAVEISYAFVGKHRAHKRCRHFSFIFDRGKLLVMGVNSYKTHPLNMKFNYINKQKDKIGSIVGTHSEMNAVVKMGFKNCEDLIMINTRINRNDRLDLSCPCNGCRDMMLKLGFSKVFFSTKNGNFESLSFNTYIVHDFARI